MSTLSGLMINYPTIRPYDAINPTINAINAASGITQGQTALLSLQKAREQQAAEQAMYAMYQANPDALLGGGGMPQSPLASLNAPYQSAITQGPLAGQPGPTQTIPAYPDASRYAEVSPGGDGPLPAGVGMPTVTPPQSTIGGLAQPPRQDPLRALMQQNPRAALMAMDLQARNQERTFNVQKQVLEMQEKKLAYYGQLLQGTTDQASWDAAREQIGRIDPRAAASLPPTFSKEARDRAVQQALAVKDKLTLDAKNLETLAEGQRKVGLTPVWGTDATGKPVLMQLSSTGEVVTPQLPPGVTPQPGGVAQIDLGTKVAIRDRSGNITGYVDKDVAGKEREEKRGQYEGERPQLAKKAQDSLAQMDIKRSVLLGDTASGQEGDIDRAIKLANEGWFTTGIPGRLGTTFGLPSAVDLDAILSTIGTNVGFDELRDIKASGGTLGAVSDFENRQLQSVLGSLKQTQSREQLVRNLTRLKTLLTESRQRRQEAYQRDFGDLSPGKERPANPGQTSQAPLKPVGEMSREELLAERDRLRKGGS